MKKSKNFNHTENTKDHLTCEVEVVEDQNISKELDAVASGLVKKFDRLQVLSKKDLNDSSNNLKNLKNSIQIANNISSNLNIQIFEKRNYLKFTPKRG